MTTEVKKKKDIDLYGSLEPQDPFDTSLEVAKLMTRKIENLAYSLTMLDFDSIGMTRLTKEQYSSVLELLLFCRTARDKFNSLQTSWYIFDSIIISILDGISYGLDFEIHLRFTVLTFIETRLQTIDQQMEIDIDELKVADRRKNRR